MHRTLRLIGAASGVGAQDPGCHAGPTALHRAHAFDDLQRRPDLSWGETLFPRQALGGRVAEQLILEDISTGASNDLQQATNIARQMITKYGFSERLGPVVYGTSQEETFLGRDLGQGKGYSETTAAEIDGEMRDIIDEAYETCRRTLTEHIDQLHALAQALMEREKLNEKEFNAVMAGETLPSREDPDAKPAEDQPAVQPVEQAETAEAAEPAEPAEAVDAAPQEAPAPETPDEGEANQ